VVEVSTQIQCPLPGQENPCSQVGLVLTGTHWTFPLELEQTIPVPQTVVSQVTDPEPWQVTNGGFTAESVLTAYPGAQTHTLFTVSYLALESTAEHLGAQLCTSKS